MVDAVQRSAYVMMQPLLGIRSVEDALMQVGPLLLLHPRATCWFLSPAQDWNRNFRVCLPSLPLIPPEII